MSLPTLVKYLLKRKRSDHDVIGGTEKKDDTTELLDTDIEKSTTGTSHSQTKSIRREERNSAYRFLPSKKHALHKIN